MTDADIFAEPEDLDDGDQFVLEIVPVGENVRTARLFGASIARHFRCDEEQVEDLKLALSEAVNRAMRNMQVASAVSPIRVTALKAAGGITFSILGPAGDAAGSSESESEFAPTEEELILALFPDANFDEGASSTEFTVALI